MFEILFSADVERDLKNIPRYHRNRRVDDIQQKLSHEPTVPRKNKTLLINLAPPWKAASAIWEIRVGNYRIFYDVDEVQEVVYIRAVREKPRGKTTKEIL